MQISMLLFFVPYLYRVELPVLRSDDVTVRSSTDAPPPNDKFQDAVDKSFESITY